MADIHLGSKTHQPAPSWMLTFADLLGIVLALFVLIYATSDRRADIFSTAFIELTSPLNNPTSASQIVSISDVASTSSYQTALLKKYVHAMPYWTVDDADEDALFVRLYGKALSDALSDGAWLDIIERFDRNVTLRVYVSDETQRLAAHLGAQSLMEMRAARGLSLPWTVSIQTSSDASIQAEIAIPSAKDSAALRYSSANGAQAEPL